MTAPAPQVAAPLPRVLDAQETAEVAALWNHAREFPTDRLRHCGLELRGDSLPGIGHLVIHQAGDSAIVLTLASLGGWLARPEIDVDRIEKTIGRSASRIGEIAGEILEATVIDRVEINQALRAVENVLLDDLLMIEDGNPRGERPSWRAIEPSDLPDMRASARLVKYLSAL